MSNDSHIALPLSTESMRRFLWCFAAGYRYRFRAGQNTVHLFQCFKPRTNSSFTDSIINYQVLSQTRSLFGQLGFKEPFRYSGAVEWLQQHCYSLYLTTLLPSPKRESSRSNCTSTPILIFIRSSIFFRVGAANMLCYFISPPLSGYLMERDPWIPLALGLGLQLLAIPITLMIPETLGLRKEDDASSDSDRMPGDISTLNSPSMDLQKHSVFHVARTLLISFVNDSAPLFKDWRVLFFIAIYPFRVACSSLDNFLIQYVPKRYHWTFAQTNYIWSIQSGASMVTLIVILPALASYLLNKKSYSATKKDLFIMRISFTCFALGYLLEGLAPNIYILIFAAVLANLGSGLGACMRALLTSFIPKDQVARLYTALAIVETLGMMVSGPIVAGLFNAGMERGSGVWQGLPWLVLGSVLVALSTLTWALRLSGEGEEKGGGVEALFSDGLERAEQVGRPESGATMGL